MCYNIGMENKESVVGVGMYADRVREILNRYEEDEDYRFSLDEYVDLAEEVLPYMDGSERAKELACDMVSLSGGLSDSKEAFLLGADAKLHEWLGEWVLATFGGMEISGEPTENDERIIVEEIEKFRKEKRLPE